MQTAAHWAPWHHMGWGGTWFMWIFWIALLVLVLVAIRWLISDGASVRGGSREDAESILQRRYASGELDEETFRRMRDELRR